MVVAVAPSGFDAHQTDEVALNAGQLAQTYQFAAQYIDDNPADQDDTGAPNLNATYAADEIAGGLSIVSIFETKGMSDTDSGVTGWESYLTSAQGTSDAKEAYDSAVAVGQPSGSAIYFAMDFDPADTIDTGGQYTQDQIHTALIDYFTAVVNYFQSQAATVGGRDYSVGVYGAGQTLEWVKDAGLTNYTWRTQSTGWEGTGGLGTNSAATTDANGNPWSMIQGDTTTFTPNAGPPFGIDPDATQAPIGSWDTQDLTACFCPGSMILTEHGEVAVEELAVGDKIVTLSGAVKPITWIGKGRTLITALNRDAAAPVIVRAGALADSVPNADLHLTAGHSLYLDDVLIPVSRLVNHRSIVRDDRAQVIEFYHVELEEQDVLVANGAPAESYRDDGNRLCFHNAVGPSFATAGATPYAPVCEDGPVIERVWRRLSDRAGLPAVEFTADADPHLLVDGERLDPLSVEEGVYRFRLDRVPHEMRIGSRRFVPAEVGSGRDCRTLGVAVCRLVLRQPGLAVEIGYEAAWLSEGFHHPEPAHGLRWTSGEGLVPSAVYGCFDGGFEVELHTAGAGAKYPLAPAAPVASKVA